MFKVKAPETFAATLTIVGQGREQKLKLVYRHRPRSAYLDLLNGLKEGKADPAEAIIELVDSWEADAELTLETVRGLEEDQPGVLWSIIQGYSEALAVARKGN